jgi:RNA polymerase sigma-70 factor (ECF subfamily)
VADVPAARTLDPPDAALIARARRGEASAFAELVGRHYPTCVRYAVRFLAHREDAEDAVQETWLRVHRGLGGYRERDVFERWLFRILLNVCRTVSGRRSRDARRFSGDAASVAEIAAPASELGMEQTIQVLLARLDPRTREALLLKHGLGLDYTEMARRTGDSVSALKMRVKRGVEALRPRIGSESEP